MRRSTFACPVLLSTWLQNSEFTAPSSSLLHFSSVFKLPSGVFTCFIPFGSASLKTAAFLWRKLKTNLHFHINSNHVSIFVEFFGGYWHKQIWEPPTLYCTGGETDLCCLVCGSYSLRGAKELCHVSLCVTICLSHIWHVVRSEGGGLCLT